MNQSLCYHKPIVFSSGINVRVSSSDGSQKVAMLKKGGFLSPKTRKALEIQGLFVLGGKIVTPICVWRSK